MNNLRNKLIAAVLIICVFGAAAIVQTNNNMHRKETYEAALQALSAENFVSAEQGFSAVRGYRDSAALLVYCKYAELYKNNKEYMGGADELSALTLKYDLEWQKDIDLLVTRIDEYWEAEIAALEAEMQRQEAEAVEQREASLKARYSGKEPADDMPVDALKYTTLGVPDKTKKCQFYDSMDVHRRYKTLYWYDDDGQVDASCLAHIPKGEKEEIIYAFSFSESVVVDSAPKHSASSHSTGTLRDDYDSPEDLWEDNRDLYENEDEAWDEWYDEW